MAWCCLVVLTATVVYRKTIMRQVQVDARGVKEVIVAVSKYKAKRKGCCPADGAPNIQSVRGERKERVCETVSCAVLPEKQKQADIFVPFR